MNRFSRKLVILVPLLAESDVCAREASPLSAEIVARPRSAHQLQQRLRRRWATKACEQSQRTSFFLDQLVGTGPAFVRKIAL